MSFSSFHPIVQRWFSETLGEPTSVQRRGWEAIREGRHTLIAAPTGSGKTLAAFLSAIDDLVQEGLQAPLPDVVRVIYVSPLKALSADIHKNLAEPRIGIERIAAELGLQAPRITSGVRTGDTTASERAAMLRKPPHILVTTPESLYLLLTAERSREMLRTARTVIVDEIHAVIGTRRGAHLALTLERLQQIVDAPLLRLGLSATQKPIEEVARYLVGCRTTNAADETESSCAIIDEGHRRAMELQLELPRSTVETVTSNEVWEEYYDRLTQLITEHRTTLVFVNTRRMAERVARHLSDRLGNDAVTAHHGSLSKEKRLDAESRLRNGTLRALVATASLELGIDIGHVDLVCQIGSPHRIATFLQRVGRSGHTISGLPKGRLFPVSRDDLTECAALLREVRRGVLDRIVTHDAPLDVLAQQLVAESACCEYSEDELFALAGNAWPYRELTRPQFDSVLQMIGEGFATKRGRRAALVHRDEVNGRVRGRRGSRMLAIASGGAIPEVADYRVLLEPDDTPVGTLNEDFAIESTAGDIFQLGNASWQIVSVGSGTVRVTDAHGAPPTIPFWLGEAPARSNELSLALSELRAGVERMLAAPISEVDNEAGTLLDRTRSAVEWLMQECAIPELAAQQIVDYLADAYRILGVLPTQETLVLERFFDESGGMQLVLHAPFGSRINKAWGLALRKRFCRQFDFELQAAATEDAILLSLGPQHSFPLADVFRYLHPASARDVLVQAFLDAPVFQTRWRWNATISLAVPRSRSGRKVPPQLQRSISDDLLAAVFPDAAACFENIGGDRQIPDHPLVNQAVRDCLEEAMDFDGLAHVLTRIHANELRLVARDTPEPSTLAHEILNAKPYAFLDDAPLEERRAHAVYSRRATQPSSANELGALDLAAIERVRDEERPDPRDADELHDALVTFGFLLHDELDAPHLFDTLVRHARAARVEISASGTASAERLTIARDRAENTLYVAAERLPELLAIHPDIMLAISAPPSRATRLWSREDALVELVRARMSLLGPTTATALAASLAVEVHDVDAALLALESEGAVLRGTFTPAAARPTAAAHVAADISLVHAGRALQQAEAATEWCDRRLLARIHRYTLTRLRAEIEPLTAADFMRFLFAWQHVTPSSLVTGVDGLHAVLAQLDGFEAAAGAWERTILPLRVEGYDPSLLDALCFSGEAGWARLSQSSGATPVSATPIALLLRQNAAAWQALREPAPLAVSERAHAILESLRARGASFVRDLGEGDETYAALGELAAAGAITSDGFGGLRALIGTARVASKDHRLAGRWSLVEPEGDREKAIELQAMTLLRRYGVIFRRLLTRETNAAPWRDLVRVYRRLEARGEIRGGRFVNGMSGEQFALPDAIERMRELRRSGSDHRVTIISAADPLNLAGIVTPGERIRAVAATKIAYRDGVPLSVKEGDYLRPLADVESDHAIEIATALTGRRVSVAAGFVGR
jgi:ATP-dependent Lhr-like helicase